MIQKKRKELIVLHIKEDKKEVYRNRAMSITGLIAAAGLLSLSGINIDLILKNDIHGFDSIVEYSKSILYFAIATLFGGCGIKSHIENKELIKDINELIEKENIEEIKPVKNLIKSLFNRK